MSTYRPMPSYRLKKIMTEIGQRHGVSLKQILADGNYQAEVSARADIAILLRSQGWTYPRIARVLGYENHTSVMHLVKHRPRPEWKAPVGFDPGKPDYSGEWAI